VRSAERDGKGGRLPGWLTGTHSCAADMLISAASAAISDAWFPRQLLLHAAAAAAQRNVIFVHDAVLSAQSAGTKSH